MSAPDWFIAAIAAEPRPGAIEVDDVVIRYRVWGSDDGLPLVLVHGGAANARWWDHIAPLLASGHRVVALDLSGHGDSGHRGSYSVDQWATEVLRVVDLVGSDNPGVGSPILIGHSLGGIVALAAAIRSGSNLGGAIIVDSPLGVPSPEDEAASERVAFGPHRVYPDVDSIVARFRPIPNQYAIPWVARHVAENSIQAVEGGWSWKFDRAIFDRRPAAPQVVPVDCRAAFIRGESGLITDAMAAAIFADFGGVAPMITLPASAHHLMLDQPLALVASLRTLLANWEIGA